MTENEAIERLQTLNIILTDKAGHEEDGIEKIFTFSDITAICTAIQALEEIQQYRAIGTPTQIYEKIGGLDVELGKYHSIGTVEDFKNAVEIIRPRKPYKRSFGVFICSLCGEKVGQAVTKTNKADCMNFCANCGSMIDWSEWERSRYERSEKM